MSMRNKRQFCFSRICETMAACDGASITSDRAMCGACERKLAQKAKTKPLKLRGETHVKYEESRRGR
jgi:hypothetical protein